MKCWGDGFQGQLGNGKKGWRDGDRTIATAPTDVSRLRERIVAISAGQDHTCALTAEGAVKCWGGNFWGQVGDGTSGWRHGVKTKPVGVKGLDRGVIAIGASR